MNSSHSQDCQNLCMERKKEGCCYLNDQFGCYWKEKEDVSPMDAGTGMAIRCSVSGMKVEFIDFVPCQNFRETKKT